MTNEEEFEANCYRIGAAIDIGQEALTELRRVKAINAELLAALQVMSDHYSGSLDHQPAYVAIGRAAIAKATK